MHHSGPNLLIPVRSRSKDALFNMADRMNARVGVIKWSRLKSGSMLYIAPRMNLAQF